MKIQLKYALPVILLFQVLMACNSGDDKEKDLTDKVNKDGAVETAVTTSHLNDSLDLLSTHHQVWVGGIMKMDIVHQDTVPALGLLHVTGENDKGETQQAEVKKDYEIYITVK